MSASTLPSPRPARPARLLWHQIRYERCRSRATRRTPVFTFAFPVLFMTVLGC